MIEEFAHALDERDQMRQQITKLRQLRQEAQITEEEYSSIAGEYKQKYYAADKTIQELKSRASSDLSRVQAVLGAYDGQLKNLQRKFEQGGLSQKDYEKQYQKILVERSREAERQSLPLLQAIVKVEKASEFREWLERSSSSSTAPIQQHFASSNSPWQDTLLQVFTGVIALALFAVVFFPFFPERLDLGAERNSSLLQISLFLKSEHSALLLLAVCPIIMGILVLLIALIPKRILRGFSLLVISTTGMVGLGIGLGVLFYFPHPLLSKFTGILVELSEARIGLAFFVGSIFVSHIIALLNIWKMKSARIMWLTSAAVAVVAGAATAAVCLLWVHTYAGVALREVSNDEDTASLEVEVFNHGNIPIYLTEALDNRPSQNTYAVSVHNKVTESSWEKVVPLESGFADSRYSEVARGESKTLMFKVPLAVEQNPCEFRVELQCAEGVAAQSENVILTRLTPDEQNPDATTEESENTVVDKTAEDNAKQLEFCREELLNMTNKLMNTKPAVLVQSINGVRGEIEKLLDQAERDRMLGLLDKAIVEAKEREATLLYEKAMQAYNSESYDFAISRFQEIIKIFRDQPQVRDEDLGARSRELLSSTEQYVKNAQLASDPNQRFQVTGVFDTGNDKRVFLNDKFTGKQLQVKAGETIALWKVVSISKNSIVIQDDKNEFTLEIR